MIQWQARGSRIFAMIEADSRHMLTDGVGPRGVPVGYARPRLVRPPPALVGPELIDLSVDRQPSLQ